MDIPRDYITLEVEKMIRDFVGNFKFMTDKQLDRLRFQIEVEQRERDLQDKGK